MPEVNGQTDQVTKVQLKSFMLDCYWGMAEVAVGGAVPIEVRTAYVADCSDIKITVKETGGGMVDTLKGKVMSNYYRASYLVKPNKSGGVFFEAEMSAHGLKRVSGVIKVFPPIKMSGFKIEDPDGKPVKEITDQESIKMSVQVKGPKNGTKAKVTLYAQTEKKSRIPAFSTMSKVEGGKVECIWKQKYPDDQGQKKSQAELDKDGETYYVPKYFFGVECLGTQAFSDPVDFSSCISMDFGDIRGQVTYVLPDGTEKTTTIPDSGVLKIDNTKVGKVNIKDFQPD